MEDSSDGNSAKNELPDTEQADSDNISKVITRSKMLILIAIRGIEILFIDGNDAWFGVSNNSGLPAGEGDFGTF